MNPHSRRAAGEPCSQFNFRPRSNPSNARPRACRPRGRPSTADHRGRFSPSSANLHTGIEKQMEALSLAAGAVVLTEPPRTTSRRPINNPGRTRSPVREKRKKKKKKKKPDGHRGSAAAAGAARHHVRSLTRIALPTSCGLGTSGIEPFGAMGTSCTCLRETARRSSTSTRRSPATGRPHVSYIRPGRRHGGRDHRASPSPAGHVVHPEHAGEHRQYEDLPSRNNPNLSWSGRRVCRHGCRRRRGPPRRPTVPMIGAPASRGTCQRGTALLRLRDVRMDVGASSPAGDLLRAPPRCASGS